MNKKETWAAIIAGTFLVAIIVISFPKIYPLMAKLLQSPLLTTSAEMLIIKTQEAIEPLKYAGDLDDIEENAPDPEGILFVSNEKANIRSTPGVVEDNIIGETTAGNYLLYFATEQINDSIWYQIQKRDDSVTGWISEVTVKEASTYENEVENLDPLEEFMDQYSQTVENAIESYDFTVVEPFLLPTGLVYEEQRNYLNYLKEQQIKQELLAYRVINALNLSDGQIWVRTVELYNITYGDGSVQRKDFISEYLLSVVGENEYKINRLLGTYQQNF